MLLHKLHSLHIANTALVAGRYTIFCGQLHPKLTIILLQGLAHKDFFAVEAVACGGVGTCRCRYDQLE